jgi:hypothetical protein
MKKRNIYIIGLLFMVMVFGNTISIFAAEEASTMMCDEGVVNIGDRDTDVQDKCGEPNSQGMNKWVYNFGPSQPVYTVIFKKGKVVRIIESQ